MIPLSKIQLYFSLMRLHQPVGIWLLFWPCAWGIGLASEWGAQSQAVLLALFFLGSVVMRGAGCIVNDLWDRDFDAHVERTRTRPLASGAVSVQAALILLATLLLLALGIVLLLPTIVFWLACFSLPLVVLYPAMKRITWWPQAFLGLTFNFGALMGWAAMRGQVDASALWLYAAGFFWTLGYDTIYAHQDKTDDINIGVKSTALLFGTRTRHYLAVFFALMLACLYKAGIQPAALLLLALPLLYQLWALRIDNPARCGQQFRFHAVYGGLVWLAALI